MVLKSLGRHFIVCFLSFVFAFNCTAWIMLQLLAEDSALKPFKSYKKSVKKLRKVGDVLTIVVVAGMISFNSAFHEMNVGLIIPDL
jgi:hypothetical protein